MIETVYVHVHRKLLSALPEMTAENYILGKIISFSAEMQLT